MSYDFDNLGVSKPASVVQLLKDGVDRYLPANNIKVGDLEDGYTRTLDFPVNLVTDVNGGRCTCVIFEDEQTMMDIFEDILNWAEHNKSSINNLDGYSYGTRNSLLKSLYEWFIVTEADIKDE